jgi:peptidoglycan hydrolase CwlO-like protein|tara:strand:- start:637 stop:840 length:204 start_codon:yes stop_codon:yes gene_type:complete
MPPATNKETQQLIELIQNMKSDVGTLQARMNRLVDELHVTKTELNAFKSNVAKDVTYLTERVDGGHF